MKFFKATTGLVAGGFVYQSIYKRVTPPQYWPLSFDPQLTYIDVDGQQFAGPNAELRYAGLAKDTPVTAYKFEDRWQDKKITESWENTEFAPAMPDGRSMGVMLWWYQTFYVNGWRKRLSLHDRKLREAYYERMYERKWNEFLKNESE